MLPHEKEEERKLVKQLPLGKKIEHFFRYYSIQTIAVLGGIFLVVSLIWNFCFRKIDQTVFAAVVYDESFEDEDKAAFIEKLRDVFELTDEHDVVRIENYYSDSTQDRMRLIVMLAAQEYDVIIAGEEKFRSIAGEGCFADLEEILDAGTLEKVSDKLIRTAGLYQTESQSLMDDNAGKGEVKAYGISLKDNPKWAELHGLYKDPVIGVLISSTRPENTLKFVDYLFE